MAEVGDLLRIVHDFEMSSIEAKIVYYVTIDDITAPSLSLPALAEALHPLFDGNVWSYVGASQAVLKRTVIDDITDGLSYGEYSEDINGGRVGSRLPPFVALSVKQNVASRLTRAGFKRIPFGIETDNEEGEWIGSEEDRELIEDYFASMIEVFQITEPFLPMCRLRNVIVGRIEEPVGSGNYVLDPTKLNFVTSAVIQKWTSQNTRKS